MLFAFALQLFDLKIFKIIFSLVKKLFAKIILKWTKFVLIFFKER